MASALSNAHSACIGVAVKMGEAGGKPDSVSIQTAFIYLSDIPETFASGQLRLLHCLAPNWVYLARGDYSRGGGLLNRLFTLAAAVSRIGGLFSVALSVRCRWLQRPILSNGIPPCGVRTFLPPARGERMPLPRLPYATSSHKAARLASLFAELPIVQENNAYVRESKLP